MSHVRLRLLVLVPLLLVGALCACGSAEVSVPVDPDPLAAVAERPLTSGLTFLSDGTYRLWDSRNMEHRQKMARGTTHRLCPPVPGNTRAVMLSLVAVNADGEGYLTAYPGPSLPIASNLNFKVGKPIANAAAVELDPSRCFFIYNGETASTHVIVDVTGRFVNDGSGAKIAPVQSMLIPAGVYPNPQGQLVLPAGGVANYRITGGQSADNIPFTGLIHGGIVNFDVADPAGEGFLTAYTGGSRGEFSHGNYSAGPQTNTQFLATDDGYLNVYTYAGLKLRSTLQAYLIERPGSDGTVTIFPPVRLLDTRQNNNYFWTDTGKRTTDLRRIKLSNLPQVPGQNAAVIANVTIADPSGSSVITPASLTVGGGNTEYPTLSFMPFQGNKANLAIVPLDDEGYATVALHSPGQRAGAQVIIDVVGTISGRAWMDMDNEPDLLASNGVGEWHKGIVSTSFYFNRHTTKAIANASSDAAAALDSGVAGWVAASPFPGDDMAYLILGGAVNGLSVIAGEVADRGECLKLTIGLHLPSPFWLSGNNGKYCKN